MDSEVLAKLEELITKQTDTINTQTETIAKLTEILTQLQSTLTVNADLVAQTLSNLNINVAAQDLAQIIIAQSGAPDMQVLSHVYTGGLVNSDDDFYTDAIAGWAIRTGRGAIATDGVTKQVGSVAIKWTLGTDTTMEQILILNHATYPYDWANFIKQMLWFRIDELPVAGGGRTKDQAIEVILSSVSSPYPTSSSDFADLGIFPGEINRIGELDSASAVFDGTDEIYFGGLREGAAGYAKMHKVNINTGQITEVTLPAEFSGYHQCRALVKVGEYIYFVMIRDDGGSPKAWTNKICKLKLSDDSVSILSPPLTDTRLYIVSGVYDGTQYVIFGIKSYVWGESRARYRFWRLDTQTDTMGESIKISSVNYVCSPNHMIRVGNYIYIMGNDLDDKGAIVKLNFSTLIDSFVGYLSANPYVEQEAWAVASPTLHGSIIYCALKNTIAGFHHFYTLDTSTDTITDKGDPGREIRSLYFDEDLVWYGCYSPYIGYYNPSSGTFTEICNFSGDYISCFVQPDEYIHFVIDKATATTAKVYKFPPITGKREYIGNEIVAVDTWYELSLVRADFVNKAEGIPLEKFVDTVIFRVRANQFTAGTVIHIDGQRFYAVPEAIVPMLGSAEGHPQVEADIKPLSGIVGHDQKTVGGTAVQLSASSIPCKSICVKAMSTNSGIIYIGKDNSVTTGNGFELTAGEGKTYDVDDVQDLWFIASAADQKVCWDAGN